VITPDSRLQVTSLANLAEILPYLLGHYPDDGMVLHCVGPNLIDGPTMACALPEDPADWKKAAEAFACHFTYTVRNRGHNPDNGIIIYLCREPDPGQGATELADDITARLIHGLHDDWARDHGFEFIEDHDLPHARRLWAFLARRCIPPYDDAAVPALTLLAAVAWRQGHLPTARLALTKALTTDPHYELADALHHAINSGAHAEGLLTAARKGRNERLARVQRTDTHPN
jgi:hypothetical protein